MHRSEFEDTLHKRYSTQQIQSYTALKKCIVFRDECLKIADELIAALAFGKIQPTAHEIALMKHTLSSSIETTPLITAVTRTDIKLTC